MQTLFPSAQAPMLPIDPKLQPLLHFIGVKKHRSTCVAERGGPVFRYEGNLRGGSQVA